MCLCRRGGSRHLGWRSLRREGLATYHGAAAVAANTDIDAGDTQEQVLPGHVCLGSAGGPYVQQQSSALVQLPTALVAENAVVADLDEPVGQNVEQEASHELIDTQPHRGVTVG